MSSTESTIASQKVAAIISTYNRYDMCLEAIRSALDQTHRNMHVIVVDDCSKDPRYASIESVISDARFKYIRLDKNTKDLLGSTQPAYVRNVGIKATDADFVAILDDDDMWLPDKIEKQLKAMYRFNHFVCCTDIYFYPTRWDNMYRNHMGEEVWRRSWSKDLFGGMKKLDAKHYLMPRKKLDEQNYVVHSTLMARRQFFFDAGLYPHVTYADALQHEDYLMILEMAQRNNGILWIDEPLGCYDGRGRWKKTQEKPEPPKAPPTRNAGFLLPLLIAIIFLFTRRR